MTEAAREVLKAFDALPPLDRQEVAEEILRRSRVPDDIPEAAFQQLADELFCAYDAEEAARVDPSTR